MQFSKRLNWVHIPHTDVRNINELNKLLVQDTDTNQEKVEESKPLEISEKEEPSEVIKQEPKVKEKKNTKKQTQNSKTKAKKK